MTRRFSRNASHLWGKDAYEVEDASMPRRDNFEVASIGQAGERGVRFANIQTRRSPTAAGAAWARSWARNCSGHCRPGTQSVPYPQSRGSGYAQTRRSNRRLAILDSQKPEWLQIKRVGTAMASECSRPRGTSRSAITGGGLARGGEGWHASNYAKELNAKPWPCNNA